MGRKNKSNSKDLHQQAYDFLTSMHAFCESTKEAVYAGTDKDKIFSFNTYQTYWKHTKYFIKYIREHHAECTTLKSAKKYVNEWLQAQTGRGMSAWTVQVEAKALGKLERGLGKAELLRHVEGMSKRIDDKDRLICTMEGESLVILSCRGHYEE